MNIREALIALNLVPGLGSATIHRLLAACGSPKAIFGAHPELLKEILGRYGTEETISQILRLPESRAVQEECERARAAGVRVVTFLDSDYPELLKNIFDPPPVLYVNGTLLKEDGAAVAIVGTRRATAYGVSTARQLGQGLGETGVTVVSGLAEGIDRASHEGALAGGGRTVAVLGHGLSTLYPAHHRTLAQKIVESGALVSEFPMAVPPQPMNFPRRNRIIAGLCLGVVVVEAPAKSGALITAHEALEQGREVFAVPGPVSSAQSKGTHQLLRDGARLVEDFRDILEELAPQLHVHLTERHLETAGRETPEGGSAKHLSQQEARVYEAIPVAAALPAESIASAATLEPAQVLPLLTKLELEGLVRQMPGQGYTRIR